MSHRTKIIVASIIVGVIVVAAGVAIWYVWFRDDAPPSASLPDREVTDDAGDAPSELDGTWTVVTDTGDAIFVGYRVDEILANGLVEQTAVGRTSAVEGTMTITDGVVTEVEFTADLTQLASDQGLRDNYLRDNSLETNTFPNATFVLTEPIELGEIPAPGEPISVTGVGELTIRDQTQEVEVEIDARWNGEVIDIAGLVPVAFADYGISTPSVQVLADIDDNGLMEFQLVLARA